MKLYKALKVKKGLIGDIAKLKEQITEKNSYLVGSTNEKEFNVENAYDELLINIDKLVGLKYAINEANKEIHGKLYTMSEYKALITFWKNVSVAEGAKKIGYSDVIHDYEVHINESKRDEYIKSFQLRVNALQDEIDEFNFGTDIPWDETKDDNREIVPIRTIEK